MTAPMDNSEKADSAVTPPRLWIAYVLPMALFMLFTAVEGGHLAWYPYLYMAKALVVGAALVGCRSVWSDFRQNANATTLILGVLVGLAVLVEWIVVDRFTPHLSFLGGSRVGYNPWEQIADPTLRALFIAVRFFGLVLIVPAMEELFWRSFLLRYLTDPDYARLRVGEFSASAFAIVAGAFALSHPEWLAALLCAVAYGLLLKQTKSLFACFVAHAVTNLTLGLYVITQHAWKFW